jgi:prepilin-type N-terminal cleavage/methylation domain-containing protein
MNQRGFTLIEMLVSTAIFTVVMVIALGALLAMSESDRKAQTLKSVINNLNFSLDSITRTVRTGAGYHCGTPSGGDCTAVPGTYFAFTDANGNSVAYCLNGTAIMREVVPGGGALDSSCAAAGFAAVTAPEVVISSLAFYLKGSTPGDGFEPKLTILLSGYVQFKGGAVGNCAANTGASTCFNLQSSVTQRIYDQ